MTVQDYRVTSATVKGNDGVGGKRRGRGVLWTLTRACGTRENDPLSAPQRSRSVPTEITDQLRNIVLKPLLLPI